MLNQNKYAIKDGEERLSVSYAFITITTYLPHKNSAKVVKDIRKEEKMISQY